MLHLQCFIFTLTTLALKLTTPIHPSNTIGQAHMQCVYFYPTNHIATCTEHTHTQNKSNQNMKVTLKVNEDKKETECYSKLDFQSVQCDIQMNGFHMDHLTVCIVSKWRDIPSHPVSVLQWRLALLQPHLLSHPYRDGMAGCVLRNRLCVHISPSPWLQTLGLGCGICRG